MFYPFIYPIKARENDTIRIDIYYLFKISESDEFIGYEIKKNQIGIFTIKLVGKETSIEKLY